MMAPLCSRLTLCCTPKNIALNPIRLPCTGTLACLSTPWRGCWDLVTPSTWASYDTLLYGIASSDALLLACEQQNEGAQVCWWQCALIFISSGLWFSNTQEYSNSPWPRSEKWRLLIGWTDDLALPFSAMWGPSTWRTVLWHQNGGIYKSPRPNPQHSCATSSGSSPCWLWAYFRAQLFSNNLSIHPIKLSS